MLVGLFHQVSESAECSFAFPALRRWVSTPEDARLRWHLAGIRPCMLPKCDYQINANRGLTVAFLENSLTRETVKRLIGKLCSHGGLRHADQNP